MRIVADTNVLVSGLLWHGTPHEVIERVRDGTLTLIISPALLAELDRVLRRAKFQGILFRAGDSPDDLIAELQQLAELMEPPPLSARISRDPDDDAVLALAVVAQAELIVSGDDDLLSIRQYEGVRIVSPAEAIGLIAGA